MQLASIRTSSFEYAPFPPLLPFVIEQDEGVERLHLGLNAVEGWLHIATAHARLSPGHGEGHRDPAYRGALGSGWSGMSAMW